ncbi:equilibrative nucleoside transporter 1 [Strongylocentrotus purpuratus]|uniref:Equilibrative nucleoside transporter 1 n=1 Tax=Strongylocentrotus purpuratus TaxID=7668 RepID=A0A7M7HN89_STRPU|nr:equilibrative nucleoside transporter 1 [Strongylocentrotus purpuratus]XP_796837.3 equilibrative nucleoside transporter 1 [Strongylocentrotus purpuratus]
MPQSATKTLEVQADLDDGSAWPTTGSTTAPVANGVMPSNPSSQMLVADIQPNGDMEMDTMNVYVVGGKSPSREKYTAMEAVSEHTQTRFDAKGELEQGPSTRAPKDRYLIAVIIFAIHGIGTLYPWNSFITAEKYFTEHKFANVSDDTEYKDKFISYLGIGGFIPNVTFLFIALFFPPKSSRFSTFGGLFVMFVLFIITTILAIVDSSGWPELFFGITMATIVIFNAASAVYQSGMYALAAKLPEGYTQSYIVGQGIGGTFVAVLSIMSITFAGSLRSAAIGYFCCAVLVLLICLITYAMLFKLPIIKHYLGLVTMVTNDKETEAAEDDPSNQSPPLWTIFKQIKMQVFNIWLTFVVTLAIFPVVLAGIPSVAENPSYFQEVYFIPLCCFFTFNLGDFFGSVLPAWFRWKWSSYTWLLVVSRLLFYPIFIFCNYRPDRRTIPVLINNDYAYAFLVVIMSVSNGYLKTVIMMDGPKMVSNPNWAGKAASMMVFFLILGIFCGIQFSLFFPWIVSL